MIRQWFDMWFGVMELVAQELGEKWFKHDDD